jgi:hypothetical protein
MDPSHEQMQNMNNDGMEMMMIWQQCSEVQACRSIRRMSRTTGVAQTQVWRILHCVGFYPYHLERVRYLLPEDQANCVQFCEWLQPQLYILFMDDV